jgi:hypothetical protein
MNHQRKTVPIGVTAEIGKFHKFSLLNLEETSAVAVAEKFGEECKTEESDIQPGLTTEARSRQLCCPQSEVD